jgi:CBS-domain-containing membrane protein
MLAYKIIEIFTSEAVRWKGKPLTDAIVEYVKGRKIAARCMVTRAIEGCYENGDIASTRLEILSMNMPLRITIALPAAQAEKILPEIEEMVPDGIVAVQDIQALSHKTEKQLIPKHIRVKDVMTASPCKVSLKTPVDQVVELLLSSHFTGVPVVDEKNHPQGIISQGDLICRAKMPLRLDVLASANAERIKNVMQCLSQVPADKIMTRPAICIREDKWLAEAVDMMMKKSLKRLPVIDAGGALSGILSRQDIFHTVAREVPDWSAFHRQNVQVGNMHCVADVMRRDIHTVFPETPVTDIIQIIDANDVQRVAVIDATSRFLGLISDKDLFSAFSEHSEGIWELFVRSFPLMERGKKTGVPHPDIMNKTARDVMNTECITIMANASIDEAIGIIVSQGIKRLPVLDTEGRFKGLISRESLMRTGFGYETEPLSTHRINECQ